jgi:hypothetical protein
VKRAVSSGLGYSDASFFRCIAHGLRPTRRDTAQRLLLPQGHSGHPHRSLDLKNSRCCIDNTATSALIALGNSQLTLALSTLVDNNTGSSMVLDFGGNTHDWRASLLYGAPGSVLLSAPFGTTLSNGLPDRA